MGIPGRDLVGREAARFRQPGNSYILIKGAAWQNPSVYVTARLCGSHVNFKCKHFICLKCFDAGCPPAMNDNQ